MSERLDRLAVILAGEHPDDPPGLVRGDEARREVTELLHAEAQRLMDTRGMTRKEAIDEVLAVARGRARNIH